MRLTLRTMLAYIDDCLEGADAEQLGKKIEDSEFASGLVHRIRNSMKKLRLTAPKLEGKGLGLDPNSVAEYLDNSLSPETVPDFEKVCLESDVHLAEVASCHQVLALILTEPAAPAETPAALRARMYRIGQPKTSPAETPQTKVATPTKTVDRVETVIPPPELPPAEAPPLPAETATKTVAKKPEPKEKKVTRAKPEVPDYLKASERRFVPLVITALLVFLVLSVVFFAIGPKQIASWFGDDKPAEGTTPEADPNPTPRVPAPTDDNLTDGVRPAETDGAKDDGGPKAPGDDGPKPLRIPDDLTKDLTPKDEKAGRDDGGPKVAPMPVPIPGVDPEPKPKPVDESPKTNVKPDDAIAKPPVEPVEPAPKPATSIDIGRFTSEKQILARFDDKGGAWYRLAANSPVSSTDRLVVPPAYRPQLMFSSGVQTTLIGPSQLQLDVTPPVGTPHVKVDYGRALLVTIGKAGAKIDLDLGGKKGSVTFSTVDSSVAIDVQRYRAPGVDPETGKRHLIVHLIAMRGGIVWEHAGKKETLGPKGVAMHIDDQAVRTGELAELPSWIVAPELASEANMQEFGAPIVERLIDTKRPILVSLEETLKHKNVDVRALATHALNQFGNHDHFLELLSDRLSKAYWDYQFDAGQQALARDPQSAADLRVALEKLRGEDGQKLYRLLWGFSPDQLTNERVTSQLVDYLNHESMEFRVLSFINLRRITGTSHLYRPEVPERFRAGHIQTWRDKLDKGEIVYKRLPLPPTLLNLTDIGAKPEPDDAKKPEDAKAPDGTGRKF